MKHTAGPTLIREDQFEQPLAPIDIGESPELVTSVVTEQTSMWVLDTGSQKGALFLFSFGIFFAVAWLLDMKYRAFTGDAFAHMANGFYILYSRIHTWLPSGSFGHRCRRLPP